uniref:G protein-coupled receptor 82 n=1 Tax=Seriola dumerili TaxID=41447 RepID=A0A3B4UIV5_SERDU
MDYTPYTPPPDNCSFSSGFSLCPTAATSFFLPSAYALLFLTALPGNTLSLWVFLRCISTTSPTHVYLSHLSISNLVLSLTTPFLASYYAWGSVWTLSGVLCQLVLHGITPMLYINIYISLMILTWVALSRFAALIQRTHASRPSVCKTLLPHGFFTHLGRASFASRVCATMWVLAVGACVPVAVYYSVNEAISAKAVCYNPEVEIGGPLSAGFCVIAIFMFFFFYLLVLLSYMTVLRHIRRSRRNTVITTSQGLLGRVFRNIVVIQVVLSVCLLPYHIFKPIFISLQSMMSFCLFLQVKNCLLLLAALRGSTDPAMYFLLDKTFRRQTLVLLESSRSNPGSRATGSPGQKADRLGDGNTATATADLSHGSAL